MNISKIKYHLFALTAVVVWGTTFVSTKLLLLEGFSPSEIMIYRFLIAYVGIWMLRPKKIFADNLKDELRCVALGLFGGSLYFLLENTALTITLASNVSLIICTAPIFTAFLMRIIYKEEKIKTALLVGSAIALVGVAFVVFNGNFILQINPLGDVLTILAAISWAFYGFFLRVLSNRYSTFFITRKVFFYGIVTIIPFNFIGNNSFHFHLLPTPTAIFHLIFLGVFASLVCFLIWNVATKNLGVVKTANYIYLSPLITLTASSIVLKEQITSVGIVGFVLILLGVYLAEKGSKEA